MTLLASSGCATSEDVGSAAGCGDDVAQAGEDCDGPDLAGLRQPGIFRWTAVLTLLTDSVDLNTTVNALHADDVTGDGTADFLYSKGGTKSVHFACNPSGAQPYIDQLVSYGSGSSTFGLGWDPTQKTLYAFDDTTMDLVVIE